MPSLPPWLLVGAIAVLLAVVVFAAFTLGRRFGARTDLRRVEQSNSLDRSALLRQGLRLQATITNIRASSGGTYITTAAATDLTTGQVKLYTQRGSTALGHLGDPITILLDPARPNVFLMVRSIG